eukprot:1798559-Ditylum_brightwellii.AAC.1
MSASSRARKGIAPLNGVIIGGVSLAAILAGLILYQRRGRETHRVKESYRDDESYDLSFFNKRELLDSRKDVSDTQTEGSLDSEKTSQRKILRDSDQMSSYDIASIIEDLNQVEISHQRSFSKGAIIKDLNQVATSHQSFPEGAIAHSTVSDSNVTASHRSRASSKLSNSGGSDVHNCTSATCQLCNDNAKCKPTFVSITEDAIGVDYRTETSSLSRHYPIDDTVTL